MRTIDLNADLGEGFGRWSLTEDEALLHVVTSANVACGFHAGDPRIMDRVCGIAAERGVAIGAQVGYRDLAGFGRRFLDVDPADLRADVLYQIGALDAFARAHGTRVAYVKPHGALYNAVVHHRVQAGAVVAALVNYDGELDLLGLPGSELLHQGRMAGVRTVAEGFVDRGYDAAARLVPRGEAGAFVPADEIPRRAVAMARDAVVISRDGDLLPAPVESLCVHGDSPGAVAVAREVAAALAHAGVMLRAFAAR